MMTEDITQRWKALEEKLAGQFGKKPDLNGILLLIGIRELGQLKQKFTKEEKVALMHIAVCRLLSQAGYYELEGLDQDGWPHWKVVQKPPYTSLFEQEMHLRHYVLEYFDELEG